MTDPTPLSPQARAVLEAVTWKKYDVPPEGLPAFAEEMAPLLAAALRAAALYCKRDRAQLVSLADELEGNPLESPNSSDGPAVPEGREPASVATKPSDQLYVLFASLEWKLGCHMAEWKAARELAYRHGKAGDDLNQAHCDGVVRLLREHLDAYGQA